MQPRACGGAGVRDRVRSRGRNRFRDRTRGRGRFRDRIRDRRPSRIRLRSRTPQRRMWRSYAVILGNMGEELQMPDQGTAHLLVRAGERLYGLPAERVRRVVSSMGLQPVAGHAPGLVGLGRFGGEPLAVVSLENIAAGRSCVWRNRSTVIVIRTGCGDDLGLLVDEALEVAAVEVDSGEGGPNGLLTQASTVDGRVVWRIDLGMLEQRRGTDDED